MAYSNHLFSTHAHTVNIYWNIQSTTIANYYITATGADFCCSKSGWRPWRKQINKTKNENWAVSFVFKWPQSLLELDQSCSRPDAAGRLWVTCGQLSLCHVYEHVELKPPRATSPYYYCFCLLPDITVTFECIWISLVLLKLAPLPAKHVAVAVLAKKWK